MSERHYQCFICGLIHHDFSEYKQHIRESHDEGREYILCPLARCNAPVRDLEAHFKAKHPNDKLPKAIQMKAMIWKDPTYKKNDGSPGMKTRKPKFREGHFVSKKNCREMHYRSGLECEVYEVCEAVPEINRYEVEPIAIPYSFRGSKHDYFPDMRVHFADGRCEIWEIKPSRQTDLAKNKAKWVAADAYCKKRGWEFLVITEIGIGKLRSHIRQGRINEAKENSGE